MEPRVDVSRLDLRVGRIISVRRHPLAETLSVQEVDVGENANRVVVSKMGAETDLEEVTPLYHNTLFVTHFNLILKMLLTFQ